ncbi:MAG: bifunctional hydroxymethylpyrimidine kinase/phosphomethylpyrimidine kinase [Abditibacteriota bacterium]|nr:bifunctional hydroxymethylpyrimidine kinase/phosphomethylpyrimidine kinase [Abditibacteriota bacterium]
MTPVALTIASVDSSSGAGVTRDLSVFGDLGVYGMSCTCNVTSQNSCGVHRIFRVAPAIIADQIDCALKDVTPGAVKIGMFYSLRAGAIIEQRIKKYGLRNIVLDTPRISKNTTPIITERAFKFLRARLLPLADVITPNAEETEALTGMHITDLSGSREACRVLCDMGAKNVIVKGGHLDTPTDILYDGRDYYEVPGEPCGRRVHGTGCTFSAALCAGLALGKSMPDAFADAKSYVNEQIIRSKRFGKTDIYYFVQGE